MPTLSLDAIQQRIAQRDAELQRLRRDLEIRRSQLQALTQRKEELQAKLRQIDAEMTAVATGTKRPQTAARKAAPKKPKPTPPVAGKPSPPSLNSLLLSALRSAGRPLTAKQLVGEVKRRGFKTESADFTKMVGTRLWDLKKQGVVQRAAGQPGYILTPSPNETAPKVGPTKSQLQKTIAKVLPTKTAKGRAVSKRASAPAPGAKPPQMSLREVLTQILKKMGAPLTGSELAQEVLKTGYQTDSTKFVNNVFVILGRMDNVEHVAGEGYRLKRGKS